MRNNSLTACVLLFTLTTLSVLLTDEFAQPRVKILKNSRKKVSARPLGQKIKSVKLMKKGIELLKSEKYNIAAERFVAVIETRPKDLKPRLLLSVCLIKLERNLQAYEVLEKTLKIYPLRMLVIS